MSAIKPVYKKYPVRDPYLYFLIITNFIFLESTILLEIITLDQIPLRPTIRKMAVKCSQTWLEDKLSFAIKAVLDMRVQKIIHFETFKMGKTTLFSSCSPCSTRRWARACWQSWGWCWGGHRSPGECLGQDKITISPSSNISFLPTHLSLSLRWGTSLVTGWHDLNDSRLQVSSGLS